MFHRKTIWALFDSGTGDYKKASDKFNIISIGIDKLREHRSNFIELNLADNNILFGNSYMFDKLDKLPKPDLIIASPPCESWSNASAMLRGNTKWYDSETTFKDGHKEKSRFTIRTKKQVGTKQNTPFKVNFVKSVRSRLNGELCALNTMEIIKRYSPGAWVIENPMTSRIWDYYEDICDWHGYRNKVRYNNYDEAYPQKPTIFFSNLKLDLNSSIKKSKVTIGVTTDGRKQIINYNDRSSIPLRLIRSIYSQVFGGELNNEIR